MSEGIAKPIIKGMKFFKGQKYVINIKSGVVEPWLQRHEDDPEYFTYIPEEFRAKEVAEEPIKAEKKEIEVEEKIEQKKSEPKVELPEDDQAETKKIKESSSARINKKSGKSVNTMNTATLKKECEALGIDTTLMTRPNMMKAYSLWWKAQPDKK